MVKCDLVEPGENAGISPESIPGSECADKSLLGNVSGFVIVAEDLEGQIEDLLSCSATMESKRVPC